MNDAEKHERTLIQLSAEIDSWLHERRLEPRHRRHDGHDDPFESRFASWLRGADAQAVLRSPRALELFLCDRQWIKRSEALVMQRFRGGNRSLWFSLLLYPLVNLFFVGVLLILMSELLVPTFRTMFDEFGLSLPPATELVLTVCGFVQSKWRGVLTVLLAAAFLCLSVWLIVQRRSNAFRPDQCQMFSTRRRIWSWWCWNVGLLVHAGVQKADAIEWVGRQCPQLWLRRTCDRWVHELQRGAVAFEPAARIGGYNRSWLLTMLQNPNRRICGDGLLAQAAIDWDRDQNLAAWTLLWCSPIALIFVGALVGFVVFALLSPLLELISGLA